MTSPPSSGLTRDDLIELAAAAFFRMDAIYYTLLTLQGLIMLPLQFLQTQASPPHSPAIQEAFQRAIVNSVLSGIAHALIAALLFYLAVPMARSIQRSLARMGDGSIKWQKLSLSDVVEPVAAALLRAMAVVLFLEVGFFQAQTIARNAWSQMLSSSSSILIMAQTVFVSAALAVIAPLLMFVFAIPLARVASTSAACLKRAEKRNLTHAHR